MARKQANIAPTAAKKVEAEAQIRALQNEIKFDLRDFTVDYIVQQFRKGHFYIPEYQRAYVWGEQHKCKFIESMILGLPIPMMFVAETDSGQLEIVDGAQRIQTLEAFLNNDLILRKLDKLTALNGFNFMALSESQQRKLANKAMRMVILEDQTSLEIRQELFKRINTSGQKARPSEVRRGTYQGRFIDFLNECAENQLFLKLCPISKSLIDRREPQELLLRFFTYSDRYKAFRHDVEKFLDSYVEDHRHTFDEGRMKAELGRVLKFVDAYFPDGFAKRQKATSTPRVRFEAIAVGVNLALREKPDLKHPNMKWLDSPEFAELTTTHASNSGPRLTGRIEYVRDSLLGG